MRLKRDQPPTVHLRSWSGSGRLRSSRGPLALRVVRNDVPAGRVRRARLRIRTLGLARCAAGWDGHRRVDEGSESALLIWIPEFRTEKNRILVKLCFKETAISAKTPGCPRWHSSASDLSCTMQKGPGAMKALTQRFIHSGGFLELAISTIPIILV